MNEPDPNDYANMEIRSFHVPDPTLVNGWWRRVYRFTLPEVADTSSFEVPVPPEGLNDAAIVVRILERASEITVQTFEREGPGIAGAVTGYLSMIAVRLKEEFGEGVEHGGRRDHPLFKIARRPENQRPYP